MWNKIYTAVLGICFVLLGVLTYYSYSWLQSVDAPKNVIANYAYYSNTGRTFLWISSISLLILANVVLWTTRSAWALWATFLYFSLFILIQTLLLDPALSGYEQRNGLGNESFSFGTVFGILLCALAGAIVFFNQFIVKRMRDKMFADSQTVNSEPSEANNDLNRNNT